MLKEVDWWSNIKVVLNCDYDLADAVLLKTKRGTSYFIGSHYYISLFSLNCKNREKYGLSFQSGNVTAI